MGGVILEDTQCGEQGYVAKMSAKTYDEVIVLEALGRREVIFELFESRNPDANARKQRAYKVADVVLLECKTLMTVDQIERLRRNKKTLLREILLRERRYCKGTGESLDMNPEKSIMRASTSLTQAEAEVAKILRRQAVMAGLEKSESFVDKASRDESGSSNDSLRIMG